LAGDEVKMIWRVGDTCIATRRLILQQPECGGPLIIECGEQGTVITILPDRSAMAVHWLQANLLGIVGKDEMSGISPNE
jgi:hypothetical protein